MHIQRQTFNFHGQLSIMIFIVSTKAYQLSIAKSAFFRTPEYQPGSLATLVRTLAVMTQIQCVAGCLEDPSCTTVTLDKAMGTCSLFANGISPPSHPSSVAAYSLDDQLPVCGNAGMKEAYLAGAGRTTFVCDDGRVVIQNREKHDLDFTKPYQAYIDGFGDFSGDFWWGLKRLHSLTSVRPYKLRVEMKQRVTGDFYYEEYTSFEVKSAAGDYELEISGPSGKASDGLAASNEMKFSTFDLNRDANSNYHCGDGFKSGWWFSSCLGGGGRPKGANLNGPAGPCTGITGRTCIIWRPLEAGTSIGLQEARMMIK